MAFEKKNGFRGQAAMEYLMTYGWAILVIVIVLAVLLFLNPFKAPETCLFAQPGFSCSDPLPQIYNDGTDTMVAMTLANKLGQSVTIKKVVCTTKAVGDISSSDPDVVTLSPEIKIGAGATGTISTDCSDVASNSQFKGTLEIWYNFENDPDPTIMRSASATLIGTVFN